MEFAPPQGHGRALVRVRRGQRQFREHLLAEQGQVCAFSGPAPERVLEAGHLYSYAQLGTHLRHGGLMLRRDIHRLFDDGMLSVSPSRLSVDVAPELARYPQYGRLHGQELHLRLRSEQVDWLAQHWQEHRATPM
ncbi:HNH endonuclease signature motif containing protein [Cellulomonas marina]|uniref:HNH endonuclease signature motif containing protein n=1 Tax=Cellulomonas marina TaxID=988821 RepID=UPI0011146D14|nr:HNH endonuclease signature motif containing protein [Cellulomonas marina]